MADQSSTSVPQPENGSAVPDDSKAGLTQEHVRAITERVYAMLLRDLKQERERERVTHSNFAMFKRG